MDGKYICKLCQKDCSDGTQRIGCMGPCRDDFHSKCIGFTPVSLNFYRSCDSLVFECEECRENPYRNLNKTLDRILSFMCIFNERLNRQGTNCNSILKHFETLNSNLQKYDNERSAQQNKLKEDGVNCTMVSNAVIDERTVTDDVVVVRPKILQKCAETRADLDKNNIPKNIAISVNNLPNGGIEIKCKNKHEKARKKLGKQYDVIIPKQRRPKIRVINMSVKRNDADIIASMMKHNEWLKDADLKVLHVYDIKHNETYGAIIEVEPKIFNTLMKKKKLIVDMNTCDVTECISVLRCYKCCGYNHKSNICRNKKACLRCGGDHELKECNATKSECTNCKLVVSRHKMDLDLHHPAWSKICPVLQRNIAKEKLRMRTIYGNDCYSISDTA